MNSTKETRLAAKAQRKMQKSNKKQQQQQQQQQHQHQHQQQQQKSLLQQKDEMESNGAKKHMNANSAVTRRITKIAEHGGNDGSNSNSNNNSCANSDNHNHNNNNNSIQNNNNINQKLREYYENQQRQRQSLPSVRTLPPGYENAPKFERSSSFSLKGKLSKFINSLTGSKESLHRVDEENAPAFKFTRSRSMILLRRTNRRSLIEPQLEQLSEEAEKSGDPTSPTSPRKNSLETFDHTADHRTDHANDHLSPATPISTTTPTTTTTIPLAAKGSQRPRSVSLLTSSPLVQVQGGSGSATSRKASTPTIALSGGSASATFDPQLNFQKRRSNTIIDSFKSTLASLTGEKKKEKLNPKWSASLQSLQAIDNMVSYENMSFIDYDKFNGYEKQLERRLSTLSLRDPPTDLNSYCSDSTSLVMPPPPAPVPPPPRLPLPLPGTPLNSSSATTPFQTPQTVVRRRERRASETYNGSARHLNERRSASRHSFRLDTDYEHNLDKPRNVYRDSLDSRKLELLNDICRNSFTLPSNVIDVLDLADGSARRSCRSICGHRNVYRRVCRHTSSSSSSTRAAPAIPAATRDAVDSSGIAQLKSKSLTQLDGLESEIACSRGQNVNNVSSSEYFSVSFCSENGCQDEEYFLATKGVTLYNAISQALKRRNLSFSQLTIIDNVPAPSLLDTGTSPLQSSLDENTDVENLAGHHLIATDRSDLRKTLQKAASFQGSRTRPPRLLSAASTEETSDVSGGGGGGKQLKQRWSGLFGIKNPQQSQLCELLNGYAKNGVPQKTATPLNFDHPDFDAALEYLDNRHKSWREIVECETMPAAETRIQTAIWELVTTEVDYIHALQTVTDLFLACLEAVQAEGLLNDVDQFRLFANIRDICEANLKFWTLYLYPMVAHSVRTREPLHVSFFQQGFVAFASIFAPYKRYCAEQSICQFYCKELNRNNSLFTAYLAWCESQKMCNRLRLADILVRPMQRLTKYSLLLAAIKKHMTDVEEIEAMDTMLHAAENFVFSVNNHLTTRQENERLKGVMVRIESYDVVDTNNESLEKMVRQYSQMFDLCAPMKGCAAHHVRHLFMEGDHKFKDNLGKADVHCFLLTDMLLVCKSIAKKGLGALKVIRQPYLTDRLVVQHSNNVLNCVYLNDFQVAIGAFTLQCSEAKNWYEALKRAKMIYMRLRQSSTANWEGLRYGGGMVSGGTTDSLGVKKSPLNSSLCSHVTSANNSHSGSVEWNDSRNISVDFEKTNSLSSDEGSSFMGIHKVKPLTTSSSIGAPKARVATASTNMLTVQPINHLGQSLPNLNLHLSHTNNTLLVPGTTTSHSGNLLLSPSHRGTSYPPPSPTRVPLRRGMAFSTSTKNPPLLKTRNITSQNSINWHQIPATPTPTSPQSQHSSPTASASATATATATATKATGAIAGTSLSGSVPSPAAPTDTKNAPAERPPADSGNHLTVDPSELATSTETDV